MEVRICLFFFFKQKTAYEIYQCDWSSDVCSSDLRNLKPVPRWLFFKAVELGDEFEYDKKDPVFHIKQIGRASCRERV